MISERKMSTAAEEIFGAERGGSKPEIFAPLRGVRRWSCTLGEVDCGRDSSGRVAEKGKG